MMKRPSALILPALLLALTALFQAAGAEPEAPAAVAVAPNWTSAVAITNDANTDEGALKPVVEISPNGNEMTIAYLRLKAPFSEPFFSTSTNGGVSWSTPTAMHSPPLAQSFFMDIAYDLNNNRHAVWTDGIDLVYKSGAGWGNNGVPTTPLSSPTFPPGASDPEIVGGNGILDVIWSEGENANPNIYHIRYAGSGWGAKQPIAKTLGSSLVPSLTRDQSGILHAVWEEASPSSTKTYYAQGTPGAGTDVSWSAIIPISKEATNDFARYPSVTTDGDAVLVSYTNWEDIGGWPPPVREDYQEIHLVKCQSNCTNVLNWNLALASSQFVGVNLNLPYDSVVSDVVHSGGCSYIYYHGTSTDFNYDKEVMWGNSSCESVREKQTPDGDEIYQTGNPNLATYGIWIYMAYEQMVNERQIYFVRGEVPSYLYLPILSKS